MIQFFCQSKATAPPNQPSPVHLAFPISKHFLIIISFQYQKQFSQQRKPIFSIGARLSLQVFPSLSFLFFSSLFFTTQIKRKANEKRKKKPTLPIFLISITFYVPIIICFFMLFPQQISKLFIKVTQERKKKNIKPRRNPDKFM